MTRNITLATFIVGISFMVVALAIILNKTTVNRPSTPHAQAYGSPTPTRGPCSAPINMRYTCNYGGNPNKVQLQWSTSSSSLIVRMDNQKNGWLYPAYKGDYMFSIPSGSYPQGISNVYVSSFVADIDLNQSYDWGLQDLKASQGGTTACRTDIIVKCLEAVPTRTPTPSRKPTATVRPSATRTPTRAPLSR